MLLFFMSTMHACRCRRCGAQRYENTKNENSEKCMQEFKIQASLVLIPTYVDVKEQQPARGGAA